MQTSCPKCSQIYPVPDGALGKTARCKKCGEVFKVEPFVELDLEEDDLAETPMTTPQPPQEQAPPKKSMIFIGALVVAAVVGIVFVILQGVFGVLMFDMDWFLVPPILAGLYCAVAYFLSVKNQSETLVRDLFIGFFVIMVLAYYTAYQFASPDFHTLAKPKHDNIEAYVMSQQFVEDRLKAPSTADFPSTSEARIKHLGSGRYQVVSYVDSENAFGANIRTHYICELHTNDGNKWICDSLVFDH